MPTFRARVYRERIAGTHASIYQQIEKSHYNKYFIELACLRRIGKIWSSSFWQLFMDHKP